MNIPKAKKLPSGQWHIRLRLNGETIYITRPTEKEAIREAELIKAEYRSGRKTYVKPSELTLDEAIEAYIEDHKGVLASTTIHGYNVIRRNRFQSVSDTQLKDIHDWQAIISREAKLCSPKTLQNAWRFVGSCIRYQGLSTPRVVLPQVNSATREWLDYEEIKVFMSAIEGSSAELCALLALSSLRRSEIFGLQWSDVDLKHEVIRVHQTMVSDESYHFVLREATKNVTSRRSVPILIPRLLQLLQERKSSGLIVTGNQNRYNEKIGGVCIEAGLPRVTMHGLRHSFASLAYHVGMDQHTCMEIGGWANPATMQKIYTHVSSRDKERHQNAMKAFYENMSKQQAKGKKGDEKGDGF